MNNERIETILKIREIRNGIDSLQLSDIEKEILKVTLNNYEDMLILDVERTNNDSNFLDELEVNHDDKVIVPVEKETLRYKKYADINDSVILDHLNNIEDIFDKINISDDKKRIILKSFKEYCLYLEQVSMMKKSNSEIYDEIFEQKTKY